jgi:hypothetical protein
VNRSVGLGLWSRQASDCPLQQRNNSREQQPRIHVTLGHDDGRGVMAERDCSSMDGARSQVQLTACFGRLRARRAAVDSMCRACLAGRPPAATPSSPRASAGSLLALQASVVPARQRLVMRAGYVGDLNSWKRELVECGTGCAALGRRDSIVADREHY